MTEKLASGVGPKRTLEEMFEHALTFLSNPLELWRSERLEDCRTALKLTFAKRLAYDREGVFPTPEISLLVKILEGKNVLKNEMVRLEGEVSNELFETLTEWSAVLEHRKSPDLPVPPCIP